MDEPNIFDQVEVSDFTKRFNPNLELKAIEDVLGSIITDIHQLRADINELKSVINILFRSIGERERL